MAFFAQKFFFVGQCNVYASSPKFLTDQMTISKITFPSRAAGLLTRVYKRHKGFAKRSGNATGYPAIIYIFILPLLFTSKSGQPVVSDSLVCILSSSSFYS